MIIDGRAIASELLSELGQRRAGMPGAIRLGIVMAANDPVIESFVRIKERVAKDLNVEIVRRDLPEPTTESAMHAVIDFKRDTSIDGVIVQLPMPVGVDVNAVLSEVGASQDIDAINPFMSDRNRIVRAPVALAVQEILTRTNTAIKGARVVVVGAGRLVGQPTATLLKDEGAYVSVLTLEEGSMRDLSEADIIVTGAGQPHFIRPEHIKTGVVLIDAGTSESAGVIQGDADPACAEKAAVFTPVPGGVGPIAVAMIFKNLLDLTAHT